MLSPQTAGWGTDLACERRKADLNTPGIAFTEDKRGTLRWERLHIFSEEGEKSIGRPRGHYHTLTLPRMDEAEEDICRSAEEALAAELQALARLHVAGKPKKVLVVGLGNAGLTPDAVGPKTAETVHATRHVKNRDASVFRSLGCAEIAVLCPGVSAQSGMEAAETIAAVCEKLKPNVVIAVDALAAKATERLGTTVQLSDTGICPGSGVGNHRAALNRETLGAPVLAVGVPTITDSRVFFAEEAERRGWEADVDWQREEGMFVSPKEIGEITTAAAAIIGAAVNRAFGVVW